MASSFHTLVRGILPALVLAAATTSAQAQDKVTFLTSWYAQAEHGGYYQAVAAGQADLKDKTILVATSGRSTWWPWLKLKYGFSDAQARPDTSSMQPFIAERAGMKVKFFMFADDGYPTWWRASSRPCWKAGRATWPTRRPATR